MEEVPGNNYVYIAKKMEEGNANYSNVANTNAEEDTPKHPYHLQLAEFQPNAWQLEEREPQKYLPLEETPLTLVDSQELLDEMMTKLKQVKEFAIDLEHHIYRSFIGFVCVIQISTRTEDFIIDTIKLKEEITVLNEVCADPNILKVLHHTYVNVIRLLQRDFGIFMINMFDILEATRSLKLQLSLAAVLKYLCAVKLDKKYNLADWRVRPLASRMINHAREDTHYLLYIYDIYRNKCLKRDGTTVDLLKTVYKKCTEICGVVCIPPEFKEDSSEKKNENFTPRQLECYRLLYKWRYEIACEQDESTAYTLPSKMLLEIARQLPTNVGCITACCNKTLPPLLKTNITQVLTLVKKVIADIPEETVVAHKKATGKRKLPNKMQKEKPFCFKCGKPGHWMENCDDSRAATAVGPYGNPRGGARRGGFVGGYGNPHGDFHSGAYGGGYGSRGFHPVPPPPSGYESVRPGYFHGYGPVRPRFDYY